MACRPLKNCSYRTEKMERNGHILYSLEGVYKEKSRGNRTGELKKREWSSRYGEVKMSK